ncbi:MAG: SRPBCC family protein [Variibacter sp.]
MSDRIEKTIELKAPVSRVWRALTDHQEFGAWFRVRMEGPFVPGQVARGRITYPGYEHIQWEAVVQKMEPERLFSFTWHPYAIDPKQDYSSEPSTLVEFSLRKIPAGTLLRVVESGFDKLPANRRHEAFRMNDEGWSIQVKNIAEHIEQTPA